MATKCPKCQFENPDDTSYCGKCATPLVAPDEALGSLTRIIDAAGRDVPSGTLIAAKYRILDKLGAGGMGEVYRAEDLSLNRQVAIKMLPAVFAMERERLARFEREAKVLASLNHPNIAAIYGLEEADDKRFLVLELVEGDTLAGRLGKGPLTLEESLDVCRQIAEGLEAAHEKSIIHRDLKPSNVKITPEGKVKILDFGLARAFRDPLSDVDLAKSPTITADMTRPGVILGTAAYMSPEQAKGKATDRRADIWAFGCVLYECLAGKRPFQGDDITEIVASILKSDPDWGALPQNVPASIRTLLSRCLQKDPGLRLRDIHDVRVEMVGERGLPAGGAIVPRRLRLSWLIAACATALVIGVLIGPAVMRYFKPTILPISQPVVRSSLRLEQGHWLEGALWDGHPTRTAMAISGNGSFIVYSAVKENPGPQDKPYIYLRRTDQLGSKPVAGTEGGINPFLSPDDRWLGFWANGKLMKVAIEGGIPVTLCDSPLAFGANWGPENAIVFSRDYGLFRVSAEGGKPEPLTTPDKTKEEISHLLPHFLPDGKGVLFTIMREPFDLQPRIAWLDLKTREWRVLLEDAADGRYVPTGHLVFLRQGALLAVPFDLERHEVTGQPVPAIANVIQALNIPHTDWNTAAGQFSISDSGWLVYAEGGITPDAQASLVWVDQKGRIEPVSSIKAPFLAPRISPDGQRIADTPVGREQYVSIYDINRVTGTRLTSEGKAVFATWTPDGKRVVFGWSKTGPYNLYWQLADGSAAMERLTTSDNLQLAGSWSPDGATLAFVELPIRELGADILLLDLQSHRVTPFLNSRAYEVFPEFSPDGRWMAYVSDESGRYDVYVRPFPGPGGKWLISQEGGTHPLWARDGKQLFYRSLDGGQVWVVDVRIDGGFSASKPRPLFNALGLGWADPIRPWDLSLDSQRFLIPKYEEIKPQSVTEMVLVQNWFEELKRLAPAGKK